MKILISFECETDKGCYDNAFYTYSKSSEITNKYVEKRIVEKYSKVFKHVNSVKFTAICCSHRQNGICYVIQLRGNQ